MQHALSTYLFKNEALSPALLDRISAAGLDAVEIFCARQHVDTRNKAHIADLASWFRGSKMRLHSLHSPLRRKQSEDPADLISITELKKDRRIAAVDEIKRALEIAEVIPCSFLIQHLGTTGEAFKMRAVDAAFAALEEIQGFAKARGVEVLIENIPNELSTADGLLRFLSETRLDLDVCFDTGHAHLDEGFGDAWEKLGGRVLSTHVHDNNGEEDLHQFPLHGEIDWRAAMDLLRRSDAPLLLEVRETPELADPLERVREVLDKLEGLEKPDES